MKLSKGLSKTNKFNFLIRNFSCNFPAKSVNFFPSFLCKKSNSRFSFFASSVFLLSLSKIFHFFPKYNSSFTLQNNFLPHNTFSTLSYICNIFHGHLESRPLLTPYAFQIPSCDSSRFFRFSLHKSSSLCRGSAMNYADREAEGVELAYEILDNTERIETRRQEKKPPQEAAGDDFNQAEDIQKAKISSETPLILMHGLLGNRRNLRSFARLLNFKKVVLVDLRNHGSSKKTRRMLFSDMSNDIIKLLNDLNIQTSTLMGHSLGGKVAMSASLLFPERVSSCISLDMGCVNYGDSNRFELLRKDGWSTREIVRAIYTLNEKKKFFKSKSEVKKDLLDLMPWLKESLLEFLILNYKELSSEKRENEESEIHSKNSAAACGYALDINIECLFQALEAYLYDFPFYTADSRPQAALSVARRKREEEEEEMKTHKEAKKENDDRKHTNVSSFRKTAIFLKAERSNFIIPEDFQMIYNFFPNAVLHTVHNAGHWLHSEKPREVSDLINRYIFC